MTKDEALKLALEALENISTALREDDVLGSDSELMLNAITAIKEALAQPDHIRNATKMMAQPVQEPVDCYGYAARLATSIWKQHYQKTAPQWQVLDDLIGVLTQIDNMAAGLISTPLPVQPEQEPVARVAEVHMSRYTIEWTNGLLPEGTELFAAPTPTLPVQERNFCPRCGKRTADLITIHTCTPPKENT